MEETLSIAVKTSNGHGHRGNPWKSPHFDEEIVNKKSWNSFQNADLI